MLPLSVEVQVKSMLGSVGVGVTKTPVPLLLVVPVVVTRSSATEQVQALPEYDGTRIA